MEDQVLRLLAEYGGPWAALSAALLSFLRSRPGRTTGRAVSGFIEYHYLRRVLHLSKDDARTRVLAHWADDPPDDTPPPIENTTPIS